MSKNTPITARVSTGLFNKKKGVTEPLLNVGQAGVHGNNQTKDIPSPSKMKGYAMKSSPFKQKVIDGKPIEVKIKGAGQRIIEETAGTPGTANYDAAVAAEGTKQVDPDKITPEMTIEANKKRAAGNAADALAAKPVKKETIIPGKDIDLKDFEVEGKRGMVESWEAGSQGRRMKKLSDDISDSEKKIGTYTDRREKHGIYTKGAIGEDGVEAEGTWAAKKGHTKRFRNAKANLAESTRNMKGSQGQYDNYSKGVSRGSSGYNNGTFSVTEQATKKSLGNVKQQIEFEKKQNTPAAVEGTTNPLTTVKETTGMVGDLKGTGKKKTPDFFKKKTPLKMKYFK